MYTNTINLDVNAIPTQQVIYGKVGDTNRQIMVEVLSDGEPYSISGAEVSLRIGEYKTTQTAASDTNVVTLPISAEMMQEPAKLYGDIVLKENGAVLSTAPFKFIVLESPNGGQTE